MKKERKFAFVKIRNDLNSIKIRANQMAEALNTESLGSNDKRIDGYDLVIYVKYPDTLENMEARKKKGIIQIVDPIDNFDFKELAARSDYIDGLIASSVSHKILLASKFDVPITDIPHHHTNFDEKRIEIRKSDDLVLGYIGDRTHYKKAKFIERHFDNLFKDVQFKNLEESYLSIDIGYAFRSDKMKKLYNSSLKLLNYMSFGIPSVMNIERGYLEVGNQGQHCLFVDSKRELIENIKYLSENYELRKFMGNESFKKAKDYHISKIRTQYIDFIKNII